MLTQSSPVALPPTPAAAVAPPTSDTTKKRRRRAPATGAAEDCFTCRGAGTKCDRRRPYCGPCLDLGQICTGYRTQLTWGVGVASRGKLRGMTLPITKAQLDERNARDAAKSSGKAKSDDGKSCSGKVGSKPRALSASGPGTPGYGGIQRQASAPNVRKLSIVTNYDFVNMEPPCATPSAARTRRESSSTPATTQLPAVSAESPALSIVASRTQAFPPARIITDHPSPQSGMASPYSTASQPRYHSPVMAPTSSPAHHYPPSPAPTTQQFYKPSFTTLPSQQQQHSPSIIMSPMSEYEPSYPSPQHQHQHYPMSSAPASAPIYDLVSNVSNGSYHSSPSMTVTTSGMGYSSMPAMHAPPRMMTGESFGHHQHHHSPGPQWTSANVGTGSHHLQTHQHHHMGHDQGGISGLLYDDDVLAASTPTSNTPHSPYDYPPTPEEQEEARRYSHSSVDASITPSYIIDIPGSLRYLIDYYDKTVCGALVAFDTPSNPYRTQILPMAFENQALLETVYALSQSHLNSRKRLGQHDSESILFGGQAAPLSPSSRALRFKSNATQLLQNQLTDPEISKHDSVSATLLMLLWYHLCEAGIAQFKTHLSGIKRLMMLREVGKETGRWGWMETVFTFMDNMAASVNNREAQLRAGYLDMVHEETTPEWGLETLVGCDRSLFMRLAGLGRVNVLSQVPKTLDAPAPICTDEDDPNPPRNEDDGRTDFWLTWNAMKRDLENWTPSTTFSPPVASINGGMASPPGSPHSRAHAAVEANNWAHATNIYRYAAMLYLDRLAYPHLPSSHAVFQSTLRKLLDHVACVPATSAISQKLLWPIFVAGAEAVLDSHRDSVRARITAMMGVGLGNRGSALGVLERVWMESDDGMWAGEGRGLKWSGLLEGDGVEYLLI